MEARKQERIESLLRQELAALFPKELEFPAGVFVDISRVHVNKSMSKIQIFVSVFPPTQEEATLGYLIRQKFNLHEALRERLERMRLPKDMEFLIDTQAKAGFEVEELLEQIRKK